MEFKPFWMAMSVSDRRKFARRCDSSPNYLNLVAFGQKRIGEAKAIAIERESERVVTCEELRPDVDWAYIRGTAPAPRSARPARRPAA